MHSQADEDLIPAQEWLAEKGDLPARLAALARSGLTKVGAGLSCSPPTSAISTRTSTANVRSRQRFMSVTCSWATTSCAQLHRAPATSLPAMIRCGSSAQCTMQTQGLEHSTGDRDLIPARVEGDLTGCAREHAPCRNLRREFFDRLALLHRGSAYQCEGSGLGQRVRMHHLEDCGKHNAT